MAQDTLPGITAIYAVPCRLLPDHMMLRAIAGMPIGIPTVGERVEFFDTPILTIEGTKVNGTSVETSTLEFAARKPLKDWIRMAFVVVRANGRTQVIGAKEPKYPVITYTETTGTPDGTAAVRRYKITHTAQKSAIDVVY